MKRRKKKNELKFQTHDTVPGNDLALPDYQRRTLESALCVYGVYYMNSYWSLANGVFVFYKDFCGGGADFEKKKKTKKEGWWLVLVLENPPHHTLQNSVTRDRILSAECPM